MKVEFSKTTAIYNTCKTIYVISLDNGDLIPIEQTEFVDDSTQWQINAWRFDTKEVFSIEEIVESFINKYKDSNTSTKITWNHS